MNNILSFIKYTVFTNNKEFMLSLIMRSSATIPKKQFFRKKERFNSKDSVETVGRGTNGTDG